MQILRIGVTLIFQQTILWVALIYKVKKPECLKNPYYFLLKYKGKSSLQMFSLFKFRPWSGKKPA